VDDYEKLRLLLDLARSLGLQVRPGPSHDGQGGGALVRLKGREILFLDGRSPVAERLAVTAKALAGRPQLEEMYLAPEIRELLGDS
jgi:hypothetical protein